MKMPMHHVMGQMRAATFTEATTGLSSMAIPKENSWNSLVYQKNHAWVQHLRSTTLNLQWPPMAPGMPLTFNDLDRSS